MRSTNSTNQGGFYEIYIFEIGSVILSHFPLISGKKINSPFLSRIKKNMTKKT